MVILPPHYQLQKPMETYEGDLARNANSPPPNGRNKSCPSGNRYRCVWYLERGLGHISRRSYWV